MPPRAAYDLLPMNVKQIRSETLENIRCTAEFLDFFAVLKTMMRAVYEDAIEAMIFHRSSCLAGAYPAQPTCMNLIRI